MKSAYEAALAEILAKTPTHLDNVKAIEAYVESLSVPVVTEAAPEPPVPAPDLPVE